MKKCGQVPHIFNYKVQSGITSEQWDTLPGMKLFYLFLVDYGITLNYHFFRFIFLVKRRNATLNRLVQRSAGTLTTWTKAWALAFIFFVVSFALILFYQLVESLFVPAEGHCGSTKDKAVEHAQRYFSLLVEDFVTKAFYLLFRLVFKTCSVVD